MMEVYIDVQDLSKSYRLGERGSLTSWWRHRGQRGRVSALDGVNFSVRPGEIVGIIGPNGAGKTTLLRILARLTPPSAGRVVMRGRVAPLINVAAGFHEELTGRENIFFAAALLGMGRTETRRKLSSIVELAGIGQFLDTPVKRYSLGMHLRLGLSIAAHQECEILLVDEVLSAADMGFQRRATGLMRDFAARGGAVLFASHQVEIVAELCPRTLLIEGGRLVADDVTAAVLASYRAHANEMDAGASGLWESVWEVL